MIKRLLAIVALAALACSPSGSGSDSRAPTLEPTLAAPSDALPSESVGTESAAPSAS